MKEVIIIQKINKGTLRMIRDHLPPGKNDERLYLVFGDADMHDLRGLVALGFKKQRAIEYEAQYRDNFLREYIDLIGRIGKENNAIEWWATDVASKNRFTSKIPQHLSQFMDIIGLAKSTPSGILVVINPFFSIVPSLRHACRKEGVDCVAVSDFARKRFFSLTTRRLRNTASLTYNFLRIFIQSVYCRLMLSKKIGLIKVSEHFDVIKTFIYDASFSKGHDYKDAFFGKLPGVLKRSKKVLILACILGKYGHCIKQIKKCSSSTIIPIEFFVSLKDLILALRMFVAAKIKIGDENFFGYNVSDIIKEELVFAKKGIQFYHFFHFWVLKKLLQRVKIDTFFLTYENNPWEKMCIAALRQESPNTFIIGYQHTIVSQASANMFMSCFEQEIMPMPDKILTVGEATKNIMEKYGNFEKGIIKPSCGLRFEYLFNMQKLPRKGTKNILLGLEGIREVYKIVAYVMKELAGDEKYKVRIRTHPVLPWEYFQRHHNFDLRKYPSFHLSPGGSLKADLEWADTVIYWGSTIGVEALNIGRPVIHYNIGSIFNYDPLFESSALKWVVNESISLAATLEKISNLSDEKFSSGWEMAKIYLNSYFYPVTGENLTGFMKDNSDILLPGRSSCAVASRARQE